jgi:hypothetical protein
MDVQHCNGATGRGGRRIDDVETARMLGKRRRLSGELMTWAFLRPRILPFPPIQHHRTFAIMGKVVDGGASRMLLFSHDVSMRLLSMPLSASHSEKTPFSLLAIMRNIFPDAGKSLTRFSLAQPFP